DEPRSVQLERALTEAQHKEYWREQDQAWNRTVAENEREIETDFPGVPQDYVKSLFEARAVRDPAFRAAWFGQQQNPRAWKIMHGRMQSEIRKKLESRIDPEATEDAEAVAQSIRGASGKV